MRLQILTRLALCYVLFEEAVLAKVLDRPLIERRGVPVGELLPEHENTEINQTPGCTQPPLDINDVATHPKSDQHAESMGSKILSPRSNNKGKGKDKGKSTGDFVQHGAPASRYVPPPPVPDPYQGASSLRGKFPPGVAGSGVGASEGPPGPSGPSVVDPWEGSSAWIGPFPGYAESDTDAAEPSKHEPPKSEPKQPEPKKPEPSEENNPDVPTNPPKNPGGTGWPYTKSDPTLQHLDPKPEADPELGIFDSPPETDTGDPNGRTREPSTDSLGQEWYDASEYPSDEDFPEAHPGDQIQSTYDLAVQNSIMNAADALSGLREADTDGFSPDQSKYLCEKSQDFPH